MAANRWAHDSLCFKYGNDRNYHGCQSLFKITIITYSDCGLTTSGKSQIPGIRRWSPGYLPGIFNQEFVDTVLDINQEEAEETMRALAKQEGIFCGVSSGGAVAGALRVAKMNPGAVIVAIICDRGDRYLSTGVFDD